MNPKAVHLLKTLEVSSGRDPRLFPILGDRQTIRTITREAMEKFQSRYLAGSAILAFEGGMDHNTVVGLAEQLFELPRGVRAPTEPPRYVGGDLRWRERLPGVRVSLSFPMPPRTDHVVFAPNRMLALMLDDIGFGSLYDRMRNANKSVYSVAAFRSTFLDYTLLRVTFNSFAHNARRNIEAVAMTIKALSENIDETLLENCKRTARLNYVMAQRDPTYGTSNLIDDVRHYGHVLPPAYHLRELEAVTVEQVKSAARAVLDRPPTFIASGDTRGLPAKREIVEIFQLEPRRQRRSPSPLPAPP